MGVKVRRPQTFIPLYTVEKEVWRLFLQYNDTPGSVLYYRLQPKPKLTSWPMQNKKTSNGSMEVYCSGPLHAPHTGKAPRHVPRSNKLEGEFAQLITPLWNFLLENRSNSCLFLQKNRNQWYKKTVIVDDRRSNNSSKEKNWIDIYFHGLSFTQWIFAISMGPSTWPCV